MAASTTPVVSQFDYTASYCEENVYRLCKKRSMNEAVDVKDLFVVFISNEKKQVPLWHQKASTRADGIVLWDYHVICIERKGEDGHLVWDLDSTLPFPCTLSTYLSETIRPSFQLFTEFQRFFRVVHAPLFFKFFASDRRHMKDSLGNWIAQPPVQAPIVAEDGTVHNLNEYIDIHDSDAVTSGGTDFTNFVYMEKLGLVVGQSQLEDFFSQISQ